MVLVLLQGVHEQTGSGQEGFLKESILPRKCDNPELGERGGLFLNHQEAIHHKNYQNQ